MRSYYEIGQDAFSLSGLASGDKGKQKHEPLYFYHVSPYDLFEMLDDDVSPDGEKVILYPIEPSSSECEIGHIRRICVAPSVEQCINAVAPEAVNRLFIYRTVRPISTTWFPYGVCDGSLTQERWLKRPTTFKEVGQIDITFSSQIIYNSNGRCKVDFSNRGSESMEKFYTQYNELKRLKKATNKHTNREWFYSRDEWIKHKNQSSLKLGLNRYGLKDILS